MKQYTKNQLCERYEVNKSTQGQTIQASRSTSRASAAALARFSLGARLDTHISQREVNKENQGDLNSFLENAYKEWAQWLTTTEKRHSQLKYNYHPYTPTEWAKTTLHTAPLHKEANTTL
jgi:hypothetical protein